MEWKDLDYHILGNIYTFLERRDQLNMSHVCRNWQNAHKLQPLWEFFTFKLVDEQLPNSTYLLIKLAENFGHMIRHVKIECSGRISYNWLRVFEEFFRTLMSSSPKLESVEFLKLKDIFLEGDYETYEQAGRVIAGFLESQDELKKVKFFNCSFQFPDGMELLRLVARKYRQSLRCLGLRGFVSYNTGGRGNIAEFTRNLPTLCDFPNLTTLDIDYSLILSNMFSPACFETLRNRETPRPALSKIILLYDDAAQFASRQRPDRSDELRVLNSTRWQILRTLLPNLKVELTIQTCLLTSGILGFLITPNMPLTRLVYKHGGMNNTFKIIERLRACQTNDHLVSLHLGIYPPDEDLVSPLDQILPFFGALKFLELSIPHSTDISNLIEHWRGNQIESLEKVVIHISDIRNDGYYRMAKILRSRYESQLNSIRRNVEVVIDYENEES